MNVAPINGVSIAYRDTGSGTPVLFIHGHPFNQSMWDTQVAALSWKYRVITFDLRGYGASEVPSAEATTLETMAADINALLDHLNIPTAVVAGLSMGGQIAMAFADQFPKRLSGLILAATFSHADTPEGANARRAMADRFIREGSALPGGEMLPKLLAPASIKKNPDLALNVYTMIAHTPPAGAAAALRGRAQRKGLHRIPAAHRRPDPHRRRNRGRLQPRGDRKAHAAVHPERPPRGLRRNRPHAQPGSHRPLQRHPA